MESKGINPSLDISLTIWYASEMSFVTRLEVQEVNSMRIHFSFLGGKIDYVRKDLDHFYQITAVAYYHLSDMVSGSGSMKGFAGFLRVVVVRWLSECSWRLSSGISGSPMGTLEVALEHDDAHLLLGKVINQRLLVYASVWHARDIAMVAMGYMTKRLHGEKYLCSGGFLRSSGKKC